MNLSYIKITMYADTNIDYYSIRDLLSHAQCRAGGIGPADPATAGPKIHYK